MSLAARAGWSHSQVAAEKREARDRSNQLAGNEDARDQEADREVWRQSFCQLCSREGSPGQQTCQACESPWMPPGIDPVDSSKHGIACETVHAPDNGIRKDRPSAADGQA